jgi:hypothetical protein
VDLVDKHDSGHHLCNTLLDVSPDNLVDLASELFSNFCAAGLYEGAHDAHNVLTTLRPRIGSVDVAESDVLHELFALVHIAFWEWDICLRFEVIGRSVRV